MKVKSRKDLRARRHARIRAKVRGCADCPRLSVMVSNRHMYVQMVDDDAGVTLVAMSSVHGQNPNAEQARELGKALGESASSKGISRFVLDRGGFRFHGRIKAMVDGVLESGLTNTKEEK